MYNHFKNNCLCIYKSLESYKLQVNIVKSCLHVFSAMQGHCTARFL